MENLKFFSIINNLITEIDIKSSNIPEKLIFYSPYMIETSNKVSISEEKSDFNYTALNKKNLSLKIPTMLINELYKMSKLHSKLYSPMSYAMDLKIRNGYVLMKHAQKAHIFIFKNGELSFSNIGNTENIMFNLKIKDDTKDIIISENL